MRFSNVFHMEAFRDKFCYKCQNWKKRGGEKIAGCPIWDVYVLYHNCYHREISDILDFLIDGTTCECQMFEEKIK